MRADISAPMMASSIEKKNHREHNEGCVIVSGRVSGVEDLLAVVARISDPNARRANCHSDKSVAVDQAAKLMRA